MRNNTKFIGPEIITLDITYNCNFRCLHCYNNSGEQNFGLKELSDVEIMKICDDIITLNPNTVCICGGEPLLRKDLVIKVIEKLTQNKNSNIKVNMVTNGYFVDDNIAQSLKIAGLNDVQVSLDGSFKEIHDWIRNNNGAFDKAINAIKCFIKHGLRVDTAFCPTKKNAGYIEETMDLCKSLGVTCFRTQPLMGLGRANKNLKEHMLDYLEYMSLSNKVIEYSKNNCNSGLMTEWGDPLEHIKSPVYTTIKYNKFISINAYGHIVMSPYIPIYLGDLKKYSLIHYWNNGLEGVWTKNVIRDICKQYTTFDKMDMNETNNVFPSVHSEKGILLDIIDDKEKFKYSFNELIECISLLK